MKTFYTVVIALLTLLAVSMSAMAQGIRKPSGSSTDPNFSLGAGLIFGGMHSEVMSGAYLDAAIGKSRIDLNFEEEITSNPSTNYVNSLPDPVPIFKRISLVYGREIVHGLASVRLAAGPEYTWGTADGKYLYSDKTSAIAGLSTDYYESNPFSRMGSRSTRMSMYPSAVTSLLAFVRASRSMAWKLTGFWE